MRRAFGTEGYFGHVERHSCYLGCKNSARKTGKHRKPEEDEEAHRVGNHRDEYRARDCRILIKPVEETEFSERPANRMWNRMAAAITAPNVNWKISPPRSCDHRHRRQSTGQRGRDRRTVFDCVSDWWRAHRHRQRLRARIAANRATIGIKIASATIASIAAQLRDDEAGDHRGTQIGVSQRTWPRASAIGR
jgi:hypothetical protein